MTTASYYTPRGGLPLQTDLLTDRAIVTEAYTVSPRGVLSRGHRHLGAPGVDRYAGMDRQPARSRVVRRRITRRSSRSSRAAVHSDRSRNPSG